jgi:transposase-like protein
MDRSSSFFDRVGREVCLHCHGQNEMAASWRRAQDAALEARGVSSAALQEDNRVVTCPRCHDLTGVLASAVHGTGALGFSHRRYRCTRCSAEF